MNWKFWERRSYTDAIVSALVQAASGESGQPRQLAAIEQAAGLWSRAFSSARVSGGFDAITPEFLGTVGRELVRSGESIWRIDVTAAGAVVLIPSATATMDGGADPSSWWYLLNEHGPSTSAVRRRPAEAVLHFRYGIDPLRPFRGVPPWSFASTSSTLAANAELRLGQEAGAPVGSLFPVPGDGGDGTDTDPLKNLKTDIANAKGNPLLVETTAAGWGEGMAAAPRADWTAKRFGADPPDALTELRKASCVELLASCGVPPSLTVANSDGTAQRESYRRFIALTIRPVSRLVEAELTAKLERPVALSFDDLRSDDLTGRARAFQSLVAGGMDTGKAAALSGLMAVDD